MAETHKQRIDRILNTSSSRKLDAPLRARVRSEMSPMASVKRAQRQAGPRAATAARSLKKYLAD